MKNFKTILTHEKCDTSPVGDSVTDQQYKRDCDINAILERYHATGVAPNVMPPPSYGDFSQITSFEDAFARVAEANARFDALPSSVRSKFGSDVREFLRWSSDPRNAHEMVKLGLATAPAPVEPVVTPKGETES